MLRGVCVRVCLCAASGSSRDVLPGPYPHIAEERAAAAKKYNLRLEDYQPHPDDGQGLVTYTHTHTFYFLDQVYLLASSVCVRTFN